ncbi:MAG: hypothetical protein V3T27_03060 [Alphaproteobacteria bacterium]
MKAMQGILYVVSALFIVSAVFIFLPWSSLNAIMGLFTPVAYPDVPIVQYTVKLFFLIFFWIGVLLAVAVYRPEQHGTTLAVIGGLCLSIAVLSLALGWIYGVAKFFYLDALSSAVIGALILLFRAQALRASRREEREQPA